ncbi:MAG: tripartite tricarboxylate transporter substrate binding protein, partial [Gammaproteobacteria bacterium]|nr:tripartite tricarboxylate transporter substrate binding protein [Gammaproteobacteria bacterium]
MKIINVTKVALLALASMMLLPVQADYPEKPIGVMVAYGPGGATDFQARIATLASGKADLIGQPIYILN